MFQSIRMSSILTLLCFLQLSCARSDRAILEAYRHWYQTAALKLHEWNLHLKKKAALEPEFQALPILIEQTETWIELNLWTFKSSQSGT